MKSFKPENKPVEEIDYFKSEQKLLKTLVERLGDSESADNFIFEIGSIANRYELPMGELGEIYSLVEQSVKGELSRDEFLDGLVKNIGATDQEVAEILVILEGILNKIKTSLKK